MTRELIFGTAGIHRIAWRPQRRRLLDLAFETGFRAFDAAPLYGNGLAELELGLALRGRRRDQVRLTTKFGIPVSLYGAARPWTMVAERAVRMALDPGYRAAFDMRDWSVVRMRADLDGSLRRLKTDYVDRFCLHEPLEALADDTWSELADTAAELKRAGKILSFGISGERPCVAAMSLRRGVDFVQTRAGLTDRLPEEFAGRVLAYGLYGQYRASGAQKDFNAYVLGLDAPVRADCVLLSSTKIGAVAAYRPLFG